MDQILLESQVAFCVTRPDDDRMLSNLINARLPNDGSGDRIDANTLWTARKIVEQSGSVKAAAVAS